MNWTKKDVSRAIETLESCGDVRKAAKKLRTTPAALRAAFQRAREAGIHCGKPSDHVGPAPLKAEPERVLVLPDLHAPYHDEKAWSTFLKVAEQWKPDSLVCLGDFADCYSVSRFTKNPSCKYTFAEEISSCIYQADRLQAALRATCCNVKFLLGNHEARLKNLIAERAPELHGLTSIPDLLGFEKRGWEWLPYGEPLRIGKIRFCHDYGPSGSRAVSQSLAATGHCVVFGHTHRAAIEYSGTTEGERHVGMTCGYLGDLNAPAFDYVQKWKAKRDWTQGFGTVQIDRETGNGWAQFHPIIGGNVIVDGKLY